MLSPTLLLVSNAFDIKATAVFVVKVPARAGHFGESLHTAREDGDGRKERGGSKRGTHYEWVQSKKNKGREIVGEIVSRRERRGKVVREKERPKSKTFPRATAGSGSALTCTTCSCQACPKGCGVCAATPLPHDQVSNSNLFPTCSKETGRYSPPHPVVHCNARKLSNF